MAIIFEKRVQVKIDYETTYFDEESPVHHVGEALWKFSLHDNSGAFQYGNGTCVSAIIAGKVDGEGFTDKKLYDTRYTNVTSEDKFEDFCLLTVEDFYGTNAKEIKLV